MVFGWTAIASMRCERAQTGVFLAVTGALCGDCVEQCLRTTSCWRVKLIYRFVGLLLREYLVMLVLVFLNEP